MTGLEILVFAVAGFAGGVVTGLVGASAVIIATPILLLFTDMSVYTAIGITLASDVACSAAAAAVYRRHKNIDLTHAPFVLGFAFLGVVLGSVISVPIPNTIFALILGVLIISSGISIATKSQGLWERLRPGGVRLSVLLALASVGIGLQAGVLGVGGGLMILTLLVVLLGYRMHVAIGTSIVYMIGIAAIGAALHYAAVPFSLTALLVMATAGALGAGLTALLANRINERPLAIIAGTLVGLAGVAVVVEKMDGLV